MAGATMVMTETETKVKKEVAAPIEVQEEGKMPPQTEGPALKPMPGVAELLEGPLIIDAKIAYGRMWVKCVAPRGHTWVELNHQHLLNDYEVHKNHANRITLVNVLFESRKVRLSSGCGGGSSSQRIGYASGQKLTGGYVNPQAHTFIPKYDRNTGRFMVDGLEVVGAGAMILGDNCVALIVDPIFRERTGG
jgi:hypothetical protein